MAATSPPQPVIVPSHQLATDHPAGIGAITLVAVISAAAFVLAFPPVSLWLAIFFAPAALGWIALTARSTRTALIVTYLVHLAMWLWLGRWLVQITTAGYPLYAVYLAIHPALFVCILRRLHRQGTPGTPSIVSSLPLTITVPVVWVGIETLRGELAFNGYPWFLMAHPLIDAPEFVQSADLLGTYFVSFLAAMISGAMLDILRYRQRRIEVGTLGPIVATTIALLAANFAYGYWRLHQTDPLETGPAMLSIQTNMPQDNKMRADMDERISYMNEFLQLTVQAYVQAMDHDIRPDLVIWPETMVFGYGFEQDTLDFLVERRFFPQDMFYRELISFVEQTGTPMLVGSPAYIGLGVDDDNRSTWDQLFNSAYLLEGQPPHQRYDKHFLTPFGETMPYISKWPRLEELLLDLGARGMRFDLDRGRGFDRLNFSWNDRTLQIAAPICFEVTMTRTCRKLAGSGTSGRADVFINLSNDGWFGWHEAGRIQHAQIARFRAIEHRTPMVRSVNTGLSMSIDSRGLINAVVGEGQYGTGGIAGAVLAVVTLDSRRTLYTMLGNSFAWVTLTLACILLGISFLHQQEHTT